jgi:hypothetical protein
MGSRENDIPELKGRKTTIILGYPSAYGNEPFTHIAIKEEGEKPKVYYIYPDYQKEMKKLPYAFYQFKGYLFYRPEILSNSFTNKIKLEAKAFDGVFIPTEWKKIK